MSKYGSGLQIQGLNHSVLSDEARDMLQTTQHACVGLNVGDGCLENREIQTCFAKDMETLLLEKSLFWLPLEGQI